MSLFEMRSPHGTPVRKQLVCFYYLLKWDIHDDAPLDITIPNARASIFRIRVAGQAKLILFYGTAPECIGK
jgi:hypothetical protein